MYLPKCSCHCLYCFRCLEHNQFFGVITLSKASFLFSSFFKIEHFDTSMNQHLKTQRMSLWPSREPVFAFTGNCVETEPQCRQNVRACTFLRLLVVKLSLGFGTPVHPTNVWISCFKCCITDIQSEWPHLQFELFESRNNDLFERKKPNAKNSEHIQR